MGEFGQTAQGAAGGALGGAAAGTAILPGWGTAIGAVAGGIIGGIGGYFGGGNPQEEYQAQLKKMMEEYQRRNPPQAGPANQAGQSALVGNRGALIAQLEALARGEGPSAARLQMQDGMERAVAAQASNAAGSGGRGVNAGAAMRNAGNQSAAIMSQGNRDMGVLRAQEQVNAMNSLGQNIATGIGQDNQQAQWNAGAMNSREELNLRAQLEALGLTDKSQLTALQLGMQGAGNQGTGTAILAGGAAAVPGIMQIGQSMNQQGQQPQGRPGYPQWGNYQGPQGTSSAPAPGQSQSQGNESANAWLQQFYKNNGV